MSQISAVPNIPKRSQKVGGLFVPAQPSLAASAPVGTGWIHEIKYDGYRIVAVRAVDQVRLWSRNGNDWSNRLAGIRHAMLELPGDVVLDGEAVAHGDLGLPDFHGLSSRAGQATAVFFAFDMLRLAGEDLRRLPLLERKDRLKKLLAGQSAIRFVDHFADSGTAVYGHACRLGLEGVVSKKADAAYPEGRTVQWLKVKSPTYGRRWRSSRSPRLTAEAPTDKTME